MTHADPFVTLVFFAAVLLAFCALAAVAEQVRKRRQWRRWDADRRSGRRATLNVRRQTGWS